MERASGWCDQVPVATVARPRGTVAACSNDILSGIYQALGQYRYMQEMEFIATNLRDVLRWYNLVFLEGGILRIEAAREETAIQTASALDTIRRRLWL